MTTSVANDEAGVLEAARIRVTEIQQAARSTRDRITGHESVTALSAARPPRREPRPGTSGTVNDHPGPDFSGPAGEAA